MAAGAVQPAARAAGSERLPSPVAAAAAGPEGGVEGEPGLAAGPAPSAHMSAQMVSRIEANEALAPYRSVHPPLPRKPVTQPG